MKTFSILLFDSTSTVKRLLEQQLSHINSLKYDLYLSGLKIEPCQAELLNRPWDLILFGQNVSTSTITNLTKHIRSFNSSVPILLLTKQSESSLPINLKKSGADDILNIAEINTPLFSWVLESTLEQIKTRKKAAEFDSMHNRLQQVDQQIASLTHELNNLLGVAKLAIFNIENPTLPEEKKGLSFKILIQSVGKIEAQIGNLRDIRKQIGQNTAAPTQALNIKSPLEKTIGI